MSTTTALPASETQAVALLEPCFLDLITAIEQAKDLPKQTQRHWACSVRQITKWLDRPAAVIPARWQAVRVSTAQLHHARLGATAKTLANHRSNVRAALRWFHKEQGAPQRGARLSPEWARLCSNWKGQFGSGSTIWFVIARPDASDQPRSTIRSLMSIGATAPRTQAGQRTIPPGDLWCGPGTAVWLR